MTRIIGIDIGTYSVKCARVDAQTKSFQLASFREYPLNQDPNSDRQIQLIEILRAIASEYMGEECRYVFAVPQTSVSTRNKVFPFKERLKILKSVPFELEDDVPLDQDDAIFEAKITQYTENGADVVACVAPRDAVRKVLELAQECGIDPDVVTVESFAFANVIEDWTAPPPTESSGTSLALEQTQVNQTSAVLYLHIGHSTTLLSVYRNRVLLATRTLLWGGRNLGDGISRKYQIQFTEALKVLQTKGFILTDKQGHTRDEVVFSDTLTESISRFVAELRLAVLEVKSQFGVEIENVFMSGGVAQIPHLGPYLTQSLEVPVNLLNHLNRYSNSYVEPTGSTPYISHVAFGLAFEGMKRTRNPAVNLRKEEFGKQSHTLQAMWNKWQYAGKVALATFGAFCVFAMLRDTIATSLVDKADTTLRTQAKTLAQLSGSRANESAIRKFVNDREREIKARQTMEQVKTITSALDIAKRLNDLVPRKDQVQIDIRHLEVQKDILTVEGEVATAAQVDILKRAWTSVASDGQVQVGQPTQAATPPKSAFSFRMKVTRWNKGAM